MVPVVYTARDMHAVTDAAEYARKQRKAIARAAKAGVRVAVHDSPAPVVAYVNANRWVVDCECGAGNATDPAWGIARCFACGATHTTVVFPDDAAAIAAALVERPHVGNRHWTPGETVAGLRAEHARMTKRG